MKLFAKLGAITYVLWGLLHIEAARKVYLLGQSLEAGKGNIGFMIEPPAPSILA